MSPAAEVRGFRLESGGGWASQVGPRLPDATGEPGSRRYGLLVGEAPGPRTDRTLPVLSGATGRRLLELIRPPRGSRWPQWLAVNLLPEWPGCSGRGSKFDAAAGREAAARLLRTDLVMGASVVVVLGARAWRAIGVARAPRLFFPYFRFFSTTVPDVPFVPAPHPSGISHWWNDPSNARLFRKEAIKWHRLLTLR